MARRRRVAAMRSRLLSLALVALVAAACGGSGASPTTNPAAAASYAASQAGAASTGAGGKGKVDCTSLKAAGADLIVGVQVLAQIRTPEALASVKDKSFGNFDPDTFIASMQKLHALDGVTSPLGDPKPAIDAYIAAGQAAKALLAESSVTQADIDAYLKNVGSLSDFLGKQMAISGAMSAAGC
jgi:hypothetical protein